MPSSTFSHTANAAATPLAVWTALQSADTWVSLGLMDSVSRAVVTDGRLVSFDWTAVAAGTRHQGTAVTAESAAGERMVLALDSSEIAGEIAVTLSPDGAGAVMTVVLTARSRGILAGMFWGVVSDALGRGLVAQVEEFAKQF